MRVVNSLSLLVFTILVGLPPADADGGCLRSGPLLGPPDLTSARLWLQAHHPCELQVRYWPKGQPRAARLSETIAVSAAGDHIARFDLEDLEPTTEYAYEIYANGDRVELGFPARFQTLPFWQWRTDPPDVRIAVGSCQYVNQPVTDRPGKPYGHEGSALYEHLLAADPQLMVWMGDNWYYREVDFGSEAALRRRVAWARENAPTRELFARVHHVATWDDHDFGPDNSNRSFRNRDAALRVFRDYWPNPSFGTDATPGIFTRVEWSDVEVFLLDNRFYRRAWELPLDDPEKTMFGDAQLRWLEDGLLSSDATFKLVVGGSQFLNDIEHKEGLHHYPRDKQRLLDFLAKTKIGGVVLVSGDRHHSELLKLEREGLPPLYELTASPLSAGAADHWEEKDNPHRVPGTFINEIHAFGLIDVRGQGADRHLVLRIVDETGAERLEKVLGLEELGIEYEPTAAH